MDYTRFDPDAPVGSGPEVIVILSHGFQGSPGQVIGWGPHYASWGLPVIVPRLCHATIFDVDHAQNGLDLVALAAELEPGARALYVGHSAGGLASFVAAAADPEAAGHLGLDTVEAFGTGAAVVGDVVVPVADLAGEPAACNSQGNAISLYQQAAGQVLRVVDADHCDYLNPPDLLCSLGCSAGPDTPSITPAIITLSTSWLLWRGGLDPDAARWWTPGEPSHDALIEQRWIQPL